MRVIAGFMMLMPLLNPCLAQQKFAPREADYVAHNFHFKSGETLAELRLHYLTLGKPGARWRWQSHKCRVDPARDWRLGASVSVTAICRRALRPGPTAGCESLLHHSSRQYRARKIEQAERWHARALSTIRLR